MMSTRFHIVVRQVLACMSVIVIACPAFASGIKQVYSWELQAIDSVATCKSTRNGDLLVYTDGLVTFNSTLFKRAKEKGAVRIDHGIVLPGSLDTNFFGVRGTMKQLVYSMLTLTGVTYQLYDVKPGPVTMPAGEFTIPALISNTLASAFWQNSFQRMLSTGLIRFLTCTLAC